MAQRLAGDQIHLVGRGVVVLVGQSVGIGKVGVGTAQLRGALVHQLHKGADAAGDAVGNDVAGLIGAVDHRAVEQVLIAHDLAGANVGGAGVGIEPLETVLLCRDHFLQRDLAALDGLDRQQHGHDLGQAGRGALLVGVEGIEQSSGVHIGQDDGLCAVQRRLVRRRRAGREEREEQADC